MSGSEPKPGLLLEVVSVAETDKGSGIRVTVDFRSAKVSQAQRSSWVTFWQRLVAEAADEARNDRSWGED